uniref:Uncharacterized protein n=1 Tax=Periophthalmus magnuspinnatus TaxID=409849 RepID=A0A3B4AK18_9GOBI
MEHCESDISPSPRAQCGANATKFGSKESDCDISESFLTVKGAALFLPRGNSPTPNSAPRLSQRRNKHTGDLQKHLQTMFTVLRPEDTIRLVSNTNVDHFHPFPWRRYCLNQVESGHTCRGIK